MKTRIIGVVGYPNCGKTTLFNSLTGAKQRVGNWPGVTVDRKTGAYRCRMSPSTLRWRLRPFGRCLRSGSTKASCKNTSEWLAPAMAVANAIRQSLKPMNGWNDHFEVATEKIVY
jgi:hypothetical protein